MIVTIDVPEVVCTKCGACAPIQPITLQLSPRKPSTGIIATDSLGNFWRVQVSPNTPRGWAPSPLNAAMLCAACYAGVLHAINVYLNPPEQVESRPIPVLAPASSIRQSQAKNPTAPEPRLTQALILAKPSSPRSSPNASAPIAAPQSIATQKIVPTGTSPIPSLPTSPVDQRLNR